ncbi:phenylacetyl-CoA ligase [Escherichia coli]|uniref:Phenylacetyl-CoA ligase n=1 Tax=Escherichia coli TaxID=562 RepID=A0A376KYE7_ECOLX|nr:phenylacetyl-CoA ligase [Escherichia coli]
MITNTKLDPIETASVDELQALQTQRLKWTLKHAYENVPMYRRNLTQQAYILMISGNFQICVNFPVPPNRICATTILRHLCRADGTSGAHSCFFGNHR